MKVATSFFLCFLALRATTYDFMGEEVAGAVCWLAAVLALWVFKKEILGEEGFLEGGDQR